MTETPRQRGDGTKPDSNDGHPPRSASPVHATFEGEPIEAEAGASVAAALIGSGRTAWRTTRAGEPRGLFCGIGVCFDCLVDIDGETGQRACMIPLAEGMRIEATASAVSEEPHKGGAS